MIRTITNTLRALFGVPRRVNVESILCRFHELVEALDAHAAASDEDANATLAKIERKRRAYEAKVAELHAEQRYAHQQAAQAAKAAENFRALLGQEVRK